jgi:hypothetical protein
MKKVIRLTESDLVNIVKRVINEQSGDFYSYLESKGYIVYKHWAQKITDSNLYRKIKESTKELGYSPNIVFCENVDKSVIPIRFITDGKKVYFLDIGIPKTIKDYVDGLRNPSKSYNGPFTVSEIKKYL